MITILLVCVAVFAVIMALLYIIAYALVIGVLALFKALIEWVSRL
jgi:hypothetical protein